MATQAQTLKAIRHIQEKLASANHPHNQLEQVEKLREKYNAVKKAEELRVLRRMRTVFGNHVPENSVHASHDKQKQFHVGYSSINFYSAKVAEAHAKLKQASEKSNLQVTKWRQKKIAELKLLETKAIIDHADPSIAEALKAIAEELNA